MAGYPQHSRACLACDLSGSVPQGCLHLWKPLMPSSFSSFSHSGLGSETWTRQRGSRVSQEPHLGSAPSQPQGPERVGSFRTKAQLQHQLCPLKGWLPALASSSAPPLHPWGSPRPRHGPQCSGPEMQAREEEEQKETAGVSVCSAEATQGWREGEARCLPDRAPSRRADPGCQTHAPSPWPQPGAGRGGG